MFKLYQERPESFPSPEETYAMQIAGRHVLSARGYTERPSGWFSLPHSPIQVYEDRWVRQIPLVAFGWWTYSYSGVYEYRNSSSRSDYTGMVSRGTLPLQFCTVLGEVEQEARYLGFQLKSRFAIDPNDFQRRFGKDLFNIPKWAGLTNNLSKHGLAASSRTLIRLTEAGQVLVEEIIKELITTAV
jgi:coproporphyrinogen III oxidase-like Fe-S oxidoreductase